MDVERRILVAVTGASGSCYAQGLVSRLVQMIPRVYLVASPSGLDVCRHELPRNDLSDGTVPLRDLLAREVPEPLRPIVRVFDSDDLFAPIASGSSVPSHMVVVPCSMGTLSRIATGASSNLIERAADVMLKQRRPLVIVPRETPLNAIHLRHMLTLVELGCHMVPAMPAFYQRPKSLEDMVSFVVGRILEVCDLPHQLYRPWNERLR